MSTAGWGGFVGQRGGAGGTVKGGGRQAQCKAEREIRRKKERRRGREAAARHGTAAPTAARRRQRRRGSPRGHKEEIGQTVRKKTVTWAPIENTDLGRRRNKWAGLLYKHIVIGPAHFGRGLQCKAEMFGLEFGGPGRLVGLQK